MLRNLNRTRDGKRVCSTSHVGVLGSRVPPAGLLFAEVQARGLAAREVRLWVQSTTLATGTLFVNDDSTWTASGASPGSYSVSGRLFVDDVDTAAVTCPFTVSAASGVPMLRNLNRRRDGKRICGTPRVGVAASAVPTIGPPYALLFNDVQANGYAGKLLRIWIEQSTFPAGSLFVHENSSYTFSGSPIADGTYSAQGRLFVDDADQGTAAFSVTVGP